METLFSPLSMFLEKLPFPLDQIKLAALYVLAIPLSLLFTKIEGVKARYYFGLITGVLFQLIIFQENIIHTFALSTLTYLLAVIFGRNCVKPVTVVIWVYLTVYHTYRMLTTFGIWRINIGFALMIGLCKCQAFVWCYRDGGKSAETLSVDQNNRKIEQLPSVLEYYSYTYFFPGALTGPFFDFKDYQDLVTRQGHYKKIDHLRANLWSLYSFVLGVLCAIGDGLYKNRFHPQHILTEEFMQHSFFYRAGWIIISGYVMRLKYYVGFYMSQSAIDACGLSYSGIIRGKHRFDNVLSCSRFVEATDNARVALERWNASTQVWLKRYVYNRILDYEKELGKKNDPFHATWITFFVSALWHGVYPSYFLTFFTVWTCISASKAVYKARAKFAWIPEPVATFLRFIFTIMTINLATCGHVLLEFDKTIRSYNSIYWAPQIYNIAAAIIIPLLGWTKHKHHHHHKKEELNGAGNGYQKIEPHDQSQGTKRS